EAPINAIWEGSGNVQALDLLRAMAKTPAVLDAWFAELMKAKGYSPVLDQAIVALKDGFSDLSEIEYRARVLTEQLALTMQAALLVQAGNNSLADAFIASRLGGSVERNYGTLPRGLDLSALLQRANPMA
ncbi:MAG: DNA alkylation response protein, partial [Alcanivoracaceae bacterium]|nr:DNA alkylation response protein [Alcanivoracaceae bacterium]